MIQNEFLFLQHSKKTNKTRKLSFVCASKTEGELANKYKRVMG